MALAVATDPTPLRVDSDGTVRVGETRVRLESIVFRHLQGGTPEEIHECFPSVPLPDVYGAVAYYLRHREELDAYIKQGEAEHPTEELRQRLRALRGPA